MKHFMPLLIVVLTQIGSSHGTINHASEDKEEIASPPTLELRRYGLKIWYDEFSSHIAH
jgi:hypothetical protein